MKRITKKVKEDLKNIIDKHGYWSAELRLYIQQFDSYTQRDMQLLAQNYDKYQYMG